MTEYSVPYSHLSLISILFWSIFLFYGQQRQLLKLQSGFWIRAVSKLLDEALASRAVMAIVSESDMTSGNAFEPEK